MHQAPRVASARTRYAAPPRGSKRSMPTPNERIAEVEVLFRAGNERMMEWTENRERAAGGEQLVFFCECGRRGCKAQVRLTGAQYEGVRADARRFVIAFGHEFREAEDVVEEHEGYVVVQKHEDVRALVERMDLRRSDSGPASYRRRLRLGTGPPARPPVRPRR